MICSKPSMHKRQKLEIYYALVNAISEDTKSKYHLYFPKPTQWAVLKSFQVIKYKFRYNK